MHCNQLVKFIKRVFSLNKREASRSITLVH